MQLLIVMLMFFLQTAQARPVDTKVRSAAKSALETGRDLKRTYKQQSKRFGDASKRKRCGKVFQSAHRTIKRKKVVHRKREGALAGRIKQASGRIPVSKIRRLERLDEKIILHANTWELLTSGCSVKTPKPKRKNKRRKHSRKKNKKNNLVASAQRKAKKTLRTLGL